MARRAIRALAGHDPEDISEYLEPGTEKHEKMVEWIAKDLEVTTLRYQNMEDLVAAIGLPREKLCLYCWNGECPEQAGQGSVVTRIGRKQAAKRQFAANE